MLLVGSLIKANVSSLIEASFDSPKLVCADSSVGPKRTLVSVKFASKVFRDSNFRILCRIPNSTTTRFKVVEVVWDSNFLVKLTLANYFRPLL